MKEYKPKSIRTLRKMIYDIKEHCEHVANNKYFGCHTCPYHVINRDNSITCYFVHIGSVNPSEWELNEMGGYV